MIVDEGPTQPARVGTQQGLDGPEAAAGVVAPIFNGTATSAISPALPASAASAAGAPIQKPLPRNLSPTFRFCRGCNRRDAAHVNGRCTLSFLHEVNR